MLEFLGDIGGLIEIVGLTIATVMAFIVERRFYGAVISDMYKVQKYTRDNSEYYKSDTAFENKKKHVITSESSDSDERRRKSKRRKDVSSSSSSFSSENLSELEEEAKVH